ncbi:MAG: hypothetical protein D6707_01315 [Bacteroidetes bacterium]|nr:MAG: hypothetical protein D6707_01315 [Bacteroidota bacterium]
MKNTLIRFFVFTCSLSFLASCNNKPSPPPEKEKNAETTKNSELALLMRKIKRDFFIFHDSLKNGKPINVDSLIAVYEQIKTATPTDSTVKEPAFYAFSEVFINRLKMLDTARANPSEIFNASIDACMDCHTAYCPGPKKVIKKLYLPNKQ